MISFSCFVFQAYCIVLKFLRVQELFEHAFDRCRFFSFFSSTFLDFFLEYTHRINNIHVKQL